MTDNGSVRAEIEIAASPEDVFAALTDPRELAMWLGGADEYSPGEWGDDAAPGMAWQSPALAPDGSQGVVRGEFLLVSEPRRIVTSWHASWEQFERTVVRFELTPMLVEGVPGTKLTVTHSAPAMSMQRVSQFGAVRESGWSAVLSRLARLMNERLTV